MAIELGALQTRALLFDIVDDGYSFVGAGEAPTTAFAPFTNIRRGIRLAIEELQASTGWMLLDSQKNLVHPVNKDAIGVEQCVSTISTGPLLKIMAVGLLSEISLESATHLAASAYAGEICTLTLDDKRKPETIIDELLHFQPDLIILAGGTDRGASQALLRLYEPVRMAYELLPVALRPEILFAGNQTLLPKFQSIFQDSNQVHYAANLTPTIAYHQLESARKCLASIICKIWRRKIPGFADLERWTNGLTIPSASAFGRMIAFISQSHPTEKGVIGVDLSYPSLSLAAAIGNHLVLGVYPLISGGDNSSKFNDEYQISQLRRWMTMPELTDAQVQAALFQQALYPASLPVIPEDFAIESAWLRSQLQQAFPATLKQKPTMYSRSAPGSFPWFEPLIISGDWLEHLPDLAHIALLFIDSLQPGGVTTLILDKNRLMPSLGAAAEVNSLLAIQVLDSQAFLHLATVISLVGDEPAGTPILRVRITYDDGREASVDVKQGNIEVLPLPSDQTADIHLQPFHRYDIGMGGAGRGGVLRVSGSSLGVIIDGRGRPLKLPDDIHRRQEMYMKWLWTMGA